MKARIMVTEKSDVRRVFMILSARSLAYARFALESLFRNCVERVSLALISDSREDVLILESELERLGGGGDSPKRAAVGYGETDLADLEHDTFRNFKHIRHF